MPKYGMVIDLQKCVGCGSCAIACKTENNTPDRARGQTFNWADFIYKMEGKFPEVKFTAIPVLCNHCTNAACVKACPVKPKAMYKTKDGITMHNNERCIGCQLCQEACPYSSKDVDKDKAAYSVISFNDFDAQPHGFYQDEKELIKGCTASGAEIAQKAGDTPPYRHLFKHPDYENVRRKGVVEKCNFCEHLVKKGNLPYCVASCPAKARIFGDLNDKKSEISLLLKKYKSFRLKVEAKTEPNVYYIRSFSPQKRA